jgi:hypothetical protein
MSDVCMHLFCVCVVLCLGSDLATGWSLVQGVLPSVKNDYETELEAWDMNGMEEPLKKWPLFTTFFLIRNSQIIQLFDAIWLTTTAAAATITIAACCYYYYCCCCCCYYYYWCYYCYCCCYYYYYYYYCCYCYYY